MPEPTTITTAWSLPSAALALPGPNGGTAGWTTNVLLVGGRDDTPARADFGVSLPTSESKYIYTGAYGFNLPSDAVIEGFECRVRARGASAVLPAVHLRDAAGGVGSTSLGSTFVLNSGFQDFVFGGPTSNPNAFSAAFVNGSNFGVRLYAIGFAAGAFIEIDSVEIRIYYHRPGAYQLAATVKAKLRLKNRIAPPPFEATAFPTVSMNEPVSVDGEWDTPDGALSPDGIYAESRRISPAGSGTSNDTPTDLLNTKMLGWTIPSIATIKNIRVRIFRGLNASDSAAKLIDHQIKLLRDGVAWGVNKASAAPIAAAGQVVSYVWSGSDLTGLTRSDMLAANFGASQQYYSTTDSPGNGKVRVHWTELRVQWDILAGTIAKTPSVLSPQMRVARPVTATATPASSARAALSVARPLRGTLTVVSTAGPAGIGKIRPVTGSLTATSAATAQLKLGVPKPLSAVVSASFGLADADPPVNYALSGTVRNPLALRPSTLTVTSIASVSGFTRRFREVLPTVWWGDTHPVLDAVLSALVATTIHVFQMIRFADLQTRIRTATGGFLDLISGDFFGTGLPRRESESDDRFRDRIRREIFRERVTRQGISKAIEDLVGTAPRIVEPQRPADTGAYGTPVLAYGTAGCWGSRHLDYQAFVDVTLPSSVGIPFVGGYGTPVLGYSVSGLGVWNDSQPVEDALTAEDVYEVLERNKPVGTVLWVHVR